jgi:hypothetical protein
MAQVIPMTDNEAMEMFSDKKQQEVDDKRSELKNYLKLVKNNEQMMIGLTNVVSRDAGYLKMEPAEKRRKIGIVLDKILGGMKVNGKEGQWSCGCFGSRWFDADEDNYGCRVAFYSKKFQKDWDWEKPYTISITFERIE